MTDSRIKYLMSLPENSVCADCRSTNPTWASTTFGAFICLKCSGIHRSLGTHITLVRSCTLDSWPPNLLSVMENVGNKKLNEFYEANLPPNFKRPNGTDVNAMKEFITQKYVFEKFRPLDRSILPPHKALSGKMKNSASSPQGINDFFAEESPRKQSAPPPSKQNTHRSMNRSQSTDIDSAISGIVSSGGSQGKSKIRLRHSRQPKETNVLRQIHKSSSSSFMDTKQNTQLEKVQSNEVFDEDIDDFFADEKPHTIIPPRPASKQKKVKIIQQAPPPTPLIEEEDKNENINSTPTETVKEDPLSKNMQLNFGSDDEPEDIDDFFSKEDSEQHEIKQLPPIQNMNTNPPAIKKPVLKSTDDSINPFSQPVNQQQEVNQPSQNAKQYEDDAPNPFINQPNSQPSENQNIIPNIEDDDGDQENIDDFFDDNPNKPKQSTEQGEAPKKKSTMQACGFVPSAEVYHPKNPDPPEFVQKMSAGIDNAKVKAAEAFSFMKNKLNSLFNDSETTSQKTTTTTSQNYQMPSSNSSKPMLSSQPSSFQTKPKPAVPEDEDIDAFFGESKPKQPPTVQTQPQTSRYRTETKGKAYKIHKRGPTQNKTPTPPQSPSKSTSYQATSSPNTEIRRQKQNSNKELSIDDAVELLLADTSSPSTKRRQRSNRH